MSNAVSRRKWAFFEVPQGVMMTAPALLIHGQVMHERLRPAHNRFVYPVFCLRLNLARLEEANSGWLGINRWRPVSIFAKDYGPRDGSSLEQWMRSLLQDTGIHADGEIWLQTFPRVFGFTFNPVSFWYCHDRDGGLRAVLAEVNNTFGETYRYLLTAAEQGVISESTTLECKKQMHVSPFCEVRGFYRFRFREAQNTMFIGLDYHDDNGLLLKTSIGGHSQALTSKALALAVFKHPFLTLGIVARIHWQALKLWIKRVPFFSKPAAPISTFSVSEEKSS